jgi:protein-disulfide isomerase
MKFAVETKFVIGIIAISISSLLIGALVTLRPAKTFEQSLLLNTHTAKRGSPDASVYLVEFSDFQCPACKMFVPVVEDIIKKHGSNIVFGYRHFPLPQHAYARYAAQAFEAANEQGKAWEMYKYLFNNQSDLSEQNVMQGAQQLGMDVEQFSKTLQSSSIQNKINQDIADGKSLGINSTPTFFLNGQKLNLFSPEDLIKAVDEAVIKASSK